MWTRLVYRFGFGDRDNELMSCTYIIHGYFLNVQRLTMLLFYIVPKV